MLCSVSMNAMVDLRRKFRVIRPHLDARMRRISAANEALSLRFGGVTLVHRTSGLSRQAITCGNRELRAGEVLEFEAQWNGRCT